MSSKSQKHKQQFKVNKMIKELLIRGMQLGVGITMFVGVTSALSTLPIIGSAAEAIRDGAQSLFGFELLGIPIGGIVGTLGGIGFLTGFYYILTNRSDIFGRTGKAAFSPGAALGEVTGTAKKIIDAV